MSSKRCYDEVNVDSDGNFAFPAPMRKKPKQAARRNNATEAMTTRVPFAEGNFRFCAKGTYTEGERKGEAQVGKWFKTGGVMEEEFFASDLRIVDKALELIEAFNASNIISQTLRLNIPEVWEWTSGECKGQKLLVEPFIEGFLSSIQTQVGTKRKIQKVGLN